MRRITYYIVLAMCVLTFAQTYGQESEIKKEIENLQTSKEYIINDEKDALKDEVEAINERLENTEITQEEAERLKGEAADKRARNIENRIAIVDNQIALLSRNGNIDTNEDSSTLNIRLFSDEKIIQFSPKRRVKKDRRTKSDFVLAVGFNNVITKGQSLDDSDFKIGGSRFAEIGWAWKTRVFRNSNWLRIKYGFSFQFNGLKPTDNRYFVDTGSQTELQEFPQDLDKSKFRMDNLVFPVHFEIGPSNKEEKEDGYVRYYTKNKLKIGVGGYAGFKLGARQKLKFDQDGEDIKQKLKASYNTNNFIYGVSGYIGWRSTALYLKYDLNTIFKDNPIEQRNISLGLRFDMD